MLVERIFEENPEEWREVLLRNMFGLFHFRHTHPFFYNTSLGINYKNENDHMRTPLHVAVMENNYELLVLLLNIPDVDINAQDKYGVTPLMYTVTCEAEFTKSFLRHSDLDINAQPTNMECALIRSLYHRNYEAFDILMSDTRTVVDVEDEEGNSPLHVAIEEDLRHAVSDLLIDTRSDPNKLNNLGLNPLATAGLNGDPHIFKMLLNSLRIELDMDMLKLNAKNIEAVIPGCLDMVNDAIKSRGK